MPHQDANEANHRTHLPRLRHALLLVILGLLALALAELAATALNSWKYALWDLLGDLLHPDTPINALNGVGYAATGAGLLLVVFLLMRLRAVHVWEMVLIILMSLVLLYAAIAPFARVFYDAGPIRLTSGIYAAPFMPARLTALAVICLGLISARRCYNQLAAGTNIPVRQDATIALILLGMCLLVMGFAWSLSIDSAVVQLIDIDDTVSPAEALAAHDHFEGLQRLGRLLALANAAALVIAAWFLFGIRRDLRRAATQNECPQCGYDLRGSAGRCPECGVNRTSDFSMPT
ncbi:MAG TPA: hypothetical protein PK400_12645 [Phycisphaerales bacterium]|nr:hypothetical protein [Phycisphaerales bacterium]HRQ76945.1 hypothetical protein [Phycisphaerales bacterium]